MYLIFFKIYRGQISAYRRAPYIRAIRCAQRGRISYSFFSNTNLTAPALYVYSCTTVAVLRSAGFHARIVHFLPRALVLNLKCPLAEVLTAVFAQSIETIAPFTGVPFASVTTPVTVLQDAVKSIASIRRVFFMFHLVGQPASPPAAAGLFEYVLFWFCAVILSRRSVSRKFTN